MVHSKQHQTSSDKNSKKQQGNETLTIEATSNQHKPNTFHVDIKFQKCSMVKPHVIIIITPKFEQANSNGNDHLSI
jgi:hypothetical protein